ncbi:MAG: hypothetical protein ABGX83_05365 [Nitrospira sp.]
MPRNKPPTLYDHCYQELLDSRVKDLKEAGRCNEIHDVDIRNLVVDYAKRTPFVKPPRTRKKKPKELVDEVFEGPAATPE